MRIVTPEDFVSALERRGLVKGIITNVSKENFAVDVVIPGFNERISGIPITPVYCSGVCNSAIIVMPRVGDIVWLLMSHEEWRVVGYVVERLVEEVRVNRTMLGEMVSTSGEVGNEANEKWGMRIMEMEEGDVGFFVHEGDRMLEFAMKRGGRIIFGFGLGLIIYDQDDVAERHFVNKFMSTDINGGSVEWGLPVIEEIGGVRVTKFNDFAFKIKQDDNNYIIFGHVDKKGLPEISEFGSDVRCKIKVNDFELSVDRDGNLIVETKNYKLNADSEKVVVDGSKEVSVGENKVEKIGGKVEVNVGKDYRAECGGTVKLDCKGNVSVTCSGNIEVTCSGNIVVKGNTVRVEGGNINITGNVNLNNSAVGVVMATILPLLEAHVHPNQGSAPSPLLSGISVTQATKSFTAV